MPKRDDDLDLTLAGTWRKDDDAAVSRWTLRTGGERYEVWVDDATAAKLFALLRALPERVERLTRERDGLLGEVQDLTRARDAARRDADAAARTSGGSSSRHLAAVPPRHERAAAPRRGGPDSLDDVPLAMIGTFRVDDPKVKAAAKKDPLMALAVQVAKAIGEDASELDRARLRAMASAVSRKDMDTFWAASTERSRKKLGG